MRQNLSQTVKYLLLLSIIIFTSNCEDTDLNVNNPPVLISIQFHGLPLASKTKGTLSDPSDISITLKDPAKLLRSPSGDHENKEGQFISDNGMLNFHIKKEKLDTFLSKEGLYTFTITANANGFLDITKTIVLSKSISKHATIFMVPDNADETPEGISIVNQTFKISAEGEVKSEVYIKNTVISEKAEPLIALSITIPEGAQLLQKDLKTPIETQETNVRAKITLFDSRPISALRAFPNNFLVTNAIEVRSNESLASPLNPIFLKTFGFFKMDFIVGEQLVGGFSNPLKIRLRIYNSKELGLDELSSLNIWQSYANEDQWRKGDKIELVEKTEDEDIEFEFETLETSNTYSSAIDLQPCAKTFVEISLNNDPGEFKSRFIEGKYNGNGGLLSFSNGNIVNIPKDDDNYNVTALAPKMEGFTFNVLESCDPMSGIKDSKSFLACPDNASIQLTNPAPADAIDCEQLLVRILCPDGNCYSFDNIGLSFEINNNGINYAGILENGRIDLETIKIPNNGQINFYIWFNQQKNQNSCLSNNGFFCFEAANICLPPCTVGSEKVVFEQMSTIQGGSICDIRRGNDKSGNCDHCTEITITLNDCKSIFGDPLPGSMFVNSGACQCD